MKISIEALKKLIQNGQQAYNVSGAVRDYLLKIKPNDIDITTSATPNQVTKLFKSYPTGLKFGSVTIVYKNKKYEVTTFRRDFNYLDSRRPEHIAYSDDPKEDAQRRDFTINSLMLNENYQLLDFVDGIKDLNNHLIRAVGIPNDRFKEDALRIMRAFYFSAKLNFDIEPNTLKAINDNAKNITNIAKERVSAELRKLFSSKYYLKGIKLLYNSNVINYLLSLKEGFKFILDNNLVLPDLEIIIILYLKNNKLPSDLLLTNKEIKELTLLNNLYMNNFVVDNYFIYKYGINRAILYNKLVGYLKPSLAITNDNISLISNTLIIKDRKELALTNPELISIINKPAGPWVVEVEEQIIKKVLNKELRNDYNEIKSYLLEVKNEI